MKNTLGEWFPRTYWGIYLLLNQIKLFLVNFDIEFESVTVYSGEIEFSLEVLIILRTILGELCQESEIPTHLKNLFELQLLEFDWHILYFGFNSDLSGSRNSVKSDNSIRKLRNFINQFLKFWIKLR
jgi:hypothetical protein